MTLNLDLELDVDTLRCELLEETAVALGLADDLSFLIETAAPAADRDRVLANYRQVRARMRTLRALLRVEEGCR